MLRKILRMSRDSGLAYPLQYRLRAVIPGRLFAIESAVVLANVLEDEGTSVRRK